MSEIVFGIIGAVVGIMGMVTAVITVSRNKKSDDKAEAKEDGVVLTELGYIKKGIHGIEERLSKQESQYIGLVEQLVEVRASTKQAHKRIDALEAYHKPVTK